MLAVLLRAAVSVRLHPFPALPHKGLLANILFTSHFSLLPFCEVRLLGLPPLQQGLYPCSSIPFMLPRDLMHWRDACETITCV